MSLRQRLLAMFALMVMLAVGAVTFIVTLRVREAYEAQEQQRTDALVAQFRREFERSGSEVAQRLERMAASERVSQMGFDLTHGGDAATYLTEAGGLAREYGLDLLEIVGPDGKIVSSAQWPARYGYAEPAVSAAGQAPFLKREDLADGQQALALYAVRAVKEVEPAVDLVGGMRLDREFLAGLSVPEGTEVFLYRNFGAGYDPQALVSAGEDAANAAAWRKILERARESGREVHEVVQPTGRHEEDVDTAAMPLKDMQGSVVAVLLIANQRRELARRLAHELKNPLFPLQITVENLTRARRLSAAEFDEVFEESTQTLLAELNNLKTIIGRFSDFSRMPKPQLEEMDVRDALKRLLALYAPALAEREHPIALRTEIAEAPLRVRADTELLHRALSNLILNAMDAMPEGGTLTVAAARRGELMEIRIADTGAGLTPEECERLFTPYYTTKQHGTGLGLAVVQAVIADHQGTVAVRGALGGGAEFVIELPVAERESMSKADILIVDDEHNTLASLARAFRMAGHEATVCDDAGRALELALARPFDLILSDVVMPRKDGLALLEEMRAKGVTAPVVMMSGQAHIEMAVRATRLGALDFLEKPISTDKLLLTVENALRLKKLETENSELRRRVGGQEIVWTGETMRRVMAMIDKVAASQSRVCIHGETGTGKELVARTLHERSGRAQGPFVTLNCAAVPAELIESELFGHEKGAFTGAMQRYVGKFEQAHRGTLFLDEIGDMPLAMQAKLLRVLEQSEVERIGGGKPVAVDVRVIVATHRDLQELVRTGKFREDLYHRVFVFPIVLPPLRERREDIAPLVRYFAAQVAAQNGWKAAVFTDEAIAALVSQGWPGNIRELRNVVERLLLLADDAVTAETVAMALPRSASPASGGATMGGSGPLAERVEAFERATIEAELARQQRNITSAARALGLERSHLYKKCHQLGIVVRPE